VDGTHKGKDVRVVSIRTRTWNRRSPVLRKLKKLGISTNLMLGVCWSYLSPFVDPERTNGSLAPKGIF